MAVEGVSDGGSSSPSEEAVTPKEKEELYRTAIQACQTNLKFLCTQIFATPHWSAVHDELATFLKAAGNRIHIELPRGHLSPLPTQPLNAQRVSQDVAKIKTQPLDVPFFAGPNDL